MDSNPSVSKIKIFLAFSQSENLSEAYIPRVHLPALVWNYVMTIEFNNVDLPVL